MLEDDFVKSVCKSFNKEKLLAQFECGGLRNQRAEREREREKKQKEIIEMIVAIALTTHHLSLVPKKQTKHKHTKKKQNIIKICANN